MRKIVIPFFLVCSFLTGCKEEENLMFGMGCI